MEFSKRQKELIHAMIQQESESIRDFYGDGPGYHIFLENHLITPTKEIVINNILKNARDLNPYTDQGFKKPELKKIKYDFQAKNRTLSYLQPHSSTHTMTTRSNIKKRSTRKPRPSTHTMTTRSNIKKIRGRSKTKKKKKKNKKKKRKSY